MECECEYISAAFHFEFKPFQRLNYNILFSSFAIFAISHPHLFSTLDSISEMYDSLFAGDEVKTRIRFGIESHSRAPKAAGELSRR